MIIVDNTETLKMGFLGEWLCEVFEEGKLMEVRRSVAMVMGGVESISSSEPLMHLGA